MRSFIIKHIYYYQLLQALVESFDFSNTCHGNRMVDWSIGIQKGATVHCLYHDCIHSRSRDSAVHYSDTTIKTG